MGSEAGLTRPSDHALTELFEAAATHVASGWCQGVSARRGNVSCAFDHDFATCFCAAGAIAKAAHAADPQGWRELYSAALAHANTRVRLSDPKLHLMSWNDHQWRTQADVVALLRECAETTRSSRGEGDGR